MFGLAAVFLLQRGHRLWADAGVVVIAAMGPARVMLGVHWTSDVLAGYAGPRVADRAGAVRPPLGGRG